MGAFGQSVENSMEFDRSRRWLRLIRFLRNSHPKGILHFQRSVRYEVVVGCSKHESFEIYAHVDELEDLVAMIEFHLENLHQEPNPEDLTIVVNPG